MNSTVEPPSQDRDASGRGVRGWVLCRCMAPRTDCQSVQAQHSRLHVREGKPIWSDIQEEVEHRSESTEVIAVETAAPRQRLRHAAASEEIVVDEEPGDPEAIEWVSGIPWSTSPAKETLIGDACAREGDKEKGDSQSEECAGQTHGDTSQGSEHGSTPGSITNCTTL